MTFNNLLVHEKLAEMSSSLFCSNPVELDINKTHTI